jgi:hypothetical protein
MNGIDEQIRNELQICISGVQSTIEFTNEDETRTRSKTILKSLQRLAHQFDKSKGGA